MITVGAGRGGVGKGLVAANIAIYFAQLGKNVVLVDADTSGSNLHAQFDLPAARSEPALEELDQALVATSVPGLSLLPAAHDAAYGPSLLRAGRKARWLAKLRTLPADYIVIDAGPGAGNFPVDLVLAADVPIAVTAPDPAAVETTYRFVRAAYRRRLRRALLRDKFRMHLFERALSDLKGLPAPLDLVRALGKMDRQLAELAWSEARRTRLYLVVNQTRMRGDLELGGWMSMLAQRHYGVALEELGHIEHDDTVWLGMRRKRPLLVDSPTCKAARNLERIGRRVVALLTTKAHEGKTALSDTPGTHLGQNAPTLYEVLGVPRTASDEEVRRAYKSQREVYANGSIAVSSLLDPPQLRAEQARLEEAYDTLLDSVRRRAYDLSTFPEPPDARTSQGPQSQKPRALAAEQKMLQAELAREIGPDTEFTGAMLRKVREAQGVDLAEISERTKIGRLHLAALEDEAWTQLPAEVYVRGFLAEVAKFLRLDPSQVQRTYLRRMRELATHHDE
ncbi:MAG TPA: helix-turn-helix domain-containing protein [Polyangiaceae bacterium]|jgi:flagellar biosynthesis protein FlhG|nr:helix-turn-helix domain-containing protein [Polyangiaceae bacterium]